LKFRKEGSEAGGGHFQAFSIEISGWAPHAHPDAGLGSMIRTPYEEAPVALHRQPGASQDGKQNKITYFNTLEKPGQVGGIWIKGHAAFGTRRMSFLGDVTQLPLSISGLSEKSLKYVQISDNGLPRRH